MAYTTPRLDLLEQSKVFFEPQFVAIGLDEKQIENHSLEELEQSRERVDEAIRNADSFGHVKVEIGIEFGRLTMVMVKSDSSYNMELGILPLLLEIKKKMFVHIVPSDILTNSFLVILGYFFGQSVGKASANSRGVSE